MNDLNLVDRAASIMWANAMYRYNQLYCNVRYIIASEDLSLEECGYLQDDAMVLCGSPYHRISGRDWGRAQLQFLAAFVA